MEKNQILDKFISEYIRPATFPVAVKFLKDQPLPPKAKVPSSFAAGPLALCQGVSIARRYGWTVGFNKEDHACPLSLLAFGYAPPSSELDNGDIALGLYAKTREAAIKCEQAVCKMEMGSVDSLLFAPLSKAEFEPDVVVVYGNPGQIGRLIQGVNYIQGGALACSFGGRFACASELIVPYLQQRCNVVVPGGGEKAFALTADDEMVFTFPIAMAEDIMEGVIGTHQGGAARYPVPQAGLRYTPQFPPSYAGLEKHCGLKVA